MPNIRYLQGQITKNTAYLDLITVAMRYGAYRVKREPTTTTNHEQRRAVAESIMQGDVARFRDFFAAYVLFDPAIQGQVYNVATGAITPQNIQDADIDRLIMAGWDDAASVRAEE